MTDTHYVNNRQLHEVLAKYIAERKAAEAEDRPLPVIPDFVAISITAICERLALKTIFSKYPFIEEMIGDGIQNNIEYIHNYNPEKYQNPFAYITQIAYWAFVRRIQKEKRYLYTKLRFTQHVLVGSEFAFDDDGQSTQKVAELTDWANRFTNDYEEAQKKAKVKKAIVETPDMV